jgi:hypothetical protein
MNGRAAAVLAVAAALASGGLAFAGDELTSLSYISYLERYATIAPARGEQPIDAVVNMPVLAGDRLDTARGARLEVVLADGCTLWIDEFTTVDFDALANSRDDPAPRTVLYLHDGGGLALEVPAAARGDGTVRIDSSAGTTFVSRPGLYRVEFDEGRLHVEVHAGLAEVPSGPGSAVLRAGQEGWRSGDGAVTRASLAGSWDDFWAWVQERRQPATTGGSAQYVDDQAGTRIHVLDSYGDWVYVPTFSSYMWRPHVGLTWMPYSSGRWVWTPVGWTWVAYEPWGWYPYHYGSWYLDASFGWVWGWGSVWGPAWVHWMHYPGYIGWCPSGYYDWWYWDHGGHGGYGGHGDPWPRPYVPGRWGDKTLDFSGRVNLGRVDQRPWTVVPSDQFGNPHVERVRVDPSRVFRGGVGDGYGRVRSGPLITPPSDRSGIRRAVEDAFGGAGEGRNLPDLSPLLEREVRSLPGAGSGPVRPVLTRDVIRTVRSSPNIPSFGRDPAGSGTRLPADRWTVARPGNVSPGTGASSSPGQPRQRMISAPPSSNGGQSGGAIRSGPGSRGSSPPSTGQRPPRESAPPSGGSSSSSQPRNQVRSAPPPARSRESAPPPSDRSTTLSDRRFPTVRERVEFQAPDARTVRDGLVTHRVSGPAAPALPSAGARAPARSIPVSAPPSGARSTGSGGTGRASGGAPRGSAPSSRSGSSSRGSSGSARSSAKPPSSP